MQAMRANRTAARMGAEPALPRAVGLGVPLPPPSQRGELFELVMLGGPVERRYRRLRPEVEALPWGTLVPGSQSPELIYRARRSWTEAAFQEHRTGIACSAALKALIAARAPLDLIALGSRFPLDEMVHVELCARLATELGGGTPLLHDPQALIAEARPGQSALMEAADLVVRFFCVGEAISIPLLRGTWQATTNPLIRAVLGRIVRDEAAHGQFGWFFLDWAGDALGAGHRKRLGEIAGETIAALTSSWDRIQPSAERTAEINALGWMEGEAYLKLARASLRSKVLEPLARRGIRPG